MLTRILLGRRMMISLLTRKLRLAHKNRLRRWGSSCRQVPPASWVPPVSIPYLLSSGSRLRDLVYIIIIKYPCQLHFHAEVFLIYTRFCAITARPPSREVRLLRAEAEELPSAPSSAAAAAWHLRLPVPLPAVPVFLREKCSGRSAYCDRCPIL